jgi:uncharacterized repeat protein (TIGR01451 family)
VVDAPFSNLNIWPPPAVDGQIAPGEYAHAGKVTFDGYAGDVEVFLRHDGSNLYIAFDSPDTTPYPYNSGGGAGPAFQVFLDTNNDKAAAPQTDDYRLSVTKGGTTMWSQGDGSSWGGGSIFPWNVAVYTATWGWQAEFSIPFASLGISSPSTATLGLALAEVWTPSWPHDWYWPAGGNWLNPSSWGYLVSSSDWSTFYWKPGPWEDYAPSGMPDFDQKQDAWSAPGVTGPVSTHCGPVSLANSLWWFDSRMETPDHAPPLISDTHRLVTSFNPGVWDDHDPQNVIPLVDTLAWYVDTNGVRTGGGHNGTLITDMHAGVLNYLRDQGLWDDYLVSLVEQPSYDWVADELLRSEDVTLLLGFWEEIAPGIWQRVGGHYVTVAGVDPTVRAIAFSDPFVDNAELGAPGRVLSGTLIPHQPIPGHPSRIHNDAGNISHDIYLVQDTNSPGGTWGPMAYPWFAWSETGFPANGESVEWMGGEIHVEVEYALTVSPYTWKASGEWQPDEEESLYGMWQPWQDYAPNGVPDFDQKQDNWTGPPAGGWTFCGPVAAANSLWWFDTKYEPTPVIPPPFNDNYPLVQSYEPTGQWDDHDPLNVDDSATPWPPPSGGPPVAPGEGEFVEDLALYVDTDGVASGIIHGGTVITDLYHGIDQYIIDHGLRQGYVITKAKSPDFWWVAEEVEVSEDVILLLGFWQDQATGPEPEWVRVGGHYLTVPGVDKKGGLIAFSDPYYDRMERTWPYAGMGSVPGWPSYLGRVANGWLIPHMPIPGHVSTIHNDAGNVSHDVYRVVGTDSPGGSWGPEEYVSDTLMLEAFLGQNGEQTGELDPALPAQAEVEWAVAVSPVSDLWVEKSVQPSTVEPGEWVTFTLTFTNAGSLPAENVALSDTLPSGLINPRWSAWFSNGFTATARTGTTYTWDLPDLAWQAWGILTVTARVDPDLVWPALTVVDNDVAIKTSSVEQYQLPELPNTATAAFTVSNPIYGVALTPTIVAKSGANGAAVVYTFTVQNTGNQSDSFNLSLANADWSTALSAPSVGPLPAGVTTTVNVTVTVPAAAVGGSYDAASLKAQSINSAAASATAAFTTTAITEYHFYLDPASDSRTDNPGNTVTYTLSVHNDGNITDTYDLSLSPTAWNTSFSGTPVGPVGPGSQEDFEVYVEIPGGASGGAQDVATVTAQSRGPSGATETSVLTTTATTQIITRGVAISPTSAAQVGDVGTTVTYTLYVTNTGNVADTLLLTATGQTWPTTLSDTSIDLVSGQGAVVHAWIQIPVSGVSEGDADTVTVEAASQGDPSQTADAVLTTTAHIPPTYAVRLLPESASVTESPGQTVTYTLTLYNDGDVADSYTLSGVVSGQSWTTTWPAQVGPVAAGASAEVTVTVQIPVGASTGQWSQATVQATSQGDPIQQDSSVLTTTAQVGTITRGVALAPSADAQASTPGTAVTYTLRVTNTGTAADTVSLSAMSSSTWTTTLVPPAVGLGAGAGADVEVVVAIPADAALNSTGVVTVTATSQADPTETAASVLTTTVKPFYIYLPLALRSYSAP